jgi:V-type H+-transporting ATPase subunit d
MMLLKGTMAGRDINELIAQAHPLGMFKESTMRSVVAFESNAKGYADLYQCVLVDTPVGKYFSKFLQESSQNVAVAGEIRNVLEETEIEIIKASLMKYYLEDFHFFCSSIGGDTGTIMCEILSVRADTQAINVTLNSFGTPLNEPSMRSTDRKRLYPSIGALYPAGTNMLAGVSDEEGLGQVCNLYPSYAVAWSVHQDGDERSIDDAFFERDTAMFELAFEGQMHFGCFYAYVKLKEQEIRNLVWITECVMQRQKESINAFIPIFSPHAPWRQKSGRR